MSTVSILQTPVMTAREAARQLRIPPATLLHWLEGGERRGSFLEPVLRPEPAGHTNMTWGEFVEARYLRTYRSQLSMQRLRPFIKEMREQFQIAYPLAHLKPFVAENRDILFRLQESTETPDALWLVFKGRNNQYVLNPLINSNYLEYVDFAPEDAQEAMRLRPLGKNRAVMQDPRVSSGAATVHGVRTAVLAERHRTGYLPEELSEEFGVSLESVHDALAFEWATQAAA